MEGTQSVVSHIGNKRSILDPYWNCLQNTKMNNEAVMKFSTKITKMAARRLQLAKIGNATNAKIFCRCLTNAANKTEEYYKKRATELVDKILRVDHAGEYGADRIYAGQMAVLGTGSAGEIIQVILVKRRSD